MIESYSLIEKNLNMIPSILSILILFSGSMGYLYFYDINTFNDVCFTISFNCIYAFSYFQIKCNQCKRFMQPHLQKAICFIGSFMYPNDSIRLSKQKRVEFVKDGIVIHESDVTNINELSSLKIPKEYDFIIWMDNDENNNMLHKIIDNTSENESDYEHVLYKFINTEIIINDTKKFNIHFKTEKYNYLMKDNVINKDFIIYFLNKHYKEQLGAMNHEELNNMKYKIKIIDHNVNLIELENDKVLKFNKHDYEIKNR